MNNQYKVLVVDDDIEMQQQVEKALIKEGYTAITASDGEQAVAKARQADIILLDIMLPKKNGFEVLREIRKMPSPKWQPVIIISGESDLENLKKGYTLEADHYLLKPCTVENILNGIRVMISLMPLRKT